MIQACFRQLLSLWKNKCITILGTQWSYEDAITAQIYEGFLEAGPQVLVQWYIQMVTSWPAIQPILGHQTRKAFYFESQKPGKFYTFIAILLSAFCQ